MLRLVPGNIGEIMAVTIQNSGGVTFTFDDGEVETIEVDKEARLDENPTPASDSDQAYILDFNGCLKTITITGVLFETTSTRTSTGTTTSIADQIAWFEAIINGSQSGSILNTNHQSNKTIFLRKLHYEEIAGNPTKLPFRIDAVEGL